MHFINLDGLFSCLQDPATDTCPAPDITVSFSPTFLYLKPLLIFLVYITTFSVLDCFLNVFEIKCSPLHIKDSCPYILIPFDFITLIVFNKKHKFKRSSKCKFLHSALCNTLHFMFFPNNDRQIFISIHNCLEIPGLHLGVNEVFALLDCYAAFVICRLPTCRYSLLVPEVRQSA